MNASRKDLYVSPWYWLYLLSIAVSGIVGLLGGLRVSHPFSLLLLAAPAIAVVAFLVLYCVGGLGIFVLFERTSNVQFQKPSILRGVMFSALMPFVFAVLAIVLFFVFQFISPMHDSL